MRSPLFSIKRKTTVAITAGALTLGVAGGAYAYWTTTGAGTGSAANASSNGTITLHAAWAAGALYPGGSQTVTFTGDNAGASDLRVGTISSVVSTSDPACLASDFTIADVVSNTTIPHGASGFALGTGTLSMANSASNQDACKGATITLTLSSN